MAQVTDIELRRGKVEISLDGVHAFTVQKRHYDKIPLEIGEELDLEAFQDRLAAAQFDDAYESALSSLDVSARPSRQLRDSLVRKGYVQAAADAVIVRLEEAGLINDLEYASRVVEYASQQNLSAYAVKQKLRAKGISSEDIDAALESMNDDQEALAARVQAERLCRKYRSLPAREGRNKLTQALARRGFSYDIAREAAEAALEDPEEY